MEPLGQTLPSARASAARDHITLFGTPGPPQPVLPPQTQPSNHFYIALNRWHSSKVLKGRQWNRTPGDLRKNNPGRVLYKCKTLRRGCVVCSGLARSPVWLWIQQDDKVRQEGSLALTVNKDPTGIVSKEGTPWECIHYSGQLRL